MQEPTQETIEKWHENSNNWKYGFFYYNKEDNRLFVDKKLKDIGGTINFAHPKASLFIIGIIAFLVLVIITVNLV